MHPINPPLSPRRAAQFDNLVKLGRWCRQYQQHGPLPADIARRFMIGQYQFAQARTWKPSTSTCSQSYAASAMHFIMVAEVIGGGVAWESHISGRLLTELHRPPMTDSDLLGVICSLSQQVIYGAHSYQSNRKTRFDKGKAARLLGHLIEDMFVRVPVDRRIEAVYDESKILIGDINKP